MTLRPVITDPLDFCRACRGRGYELEDNGHGQPVSFSCPACSGTGSRAMLLGDQPAD